MRTPLLQQADSVISTCSIHQLPLTIHQIGARYTAGTFSRLRSDLGAVTPVNLTATAGNQATATKVINDISEPHKPTGIISN